MFKGKTVMITGGTGSFGSTVLNRLVATDIDQLIIFSRDEKKQDDLRQKYSDKRLKFIIGDVRDRDALYGAMDNVDYIFHAAALKQVPSCEFFPMEAFKTNVIGLDNVLSTAITKGVKRVVALSTDKAVYPINAMGISKAMGEKILVAKSRTVQSDNNPVMSLTRYGNVMASRGSVIPLFVDKIKKNLPLTITDPSMTRFLMSLEDSVDLVFHAFNNGAQGDIFVQKAPAATIECLVEALCELFNAKSEKVIIGSRHGEKLYESLVSREEMAKAEDMGRYYRIPADIRDLNYGNYFSDGDIKINQIDDYTSHNTSRLTVEEVKKLLLTLDYIKEELSTK